VKSPGSGTRPAPASVLTSSIGAKLVLIPAGEFVMGASAGDGNADSWELPQHSVRIHEPFYIGTTEVTQGQFRAVTGRSPSRFHGSDDHPVEQVSWHDAVAFCNALSAKEGLSPFYTLAGRNAGVPDRHSPGYRLPTEAEWEYACSAGSTERFYFGSASALLDRFAWYKANSLGRSHPVGQKGPNNFGLYDMLGNVWEWCGDRFSESYYRVSPAADPTGPAAGRRCVYRGGSWNHEPRHCRSTTRHSEPPEVRDSRLGFRLARSVAPPGAGLAN
jgi:formylglycine-generating enzyme required for sulfatase activity